MARQFHREPIDGGDTGVWGSPELQQNRIALGINTLQLYDDGGDLKAPIGKCGLITTSIYGVCYNTAIETINLAAVTNGNWFKVEVQRSGTSFIFVASDTSTGVDTDPETIPSGFDSAYDANKGGYYINTNYRTITVGYLDGSGDLKAVINTYSSMKGYHGQIYAGDFDIDINKVGDTRNRVDVPIGSIIAWHKSFANTPSLPNNFLECDGSVINDSDSPYNGQTLPNLNGDARFLRGGAVSGTEQDDAMQRITGSCSSTLLSANSMTGTGVFTEAIIGTPSIEADNAAEGTEYTGYTFDSADSVAPNAAKTDDEETRPINMSVVWIMRIK
jgi:hypothetical protein